MKTVVVELTDEEVETLKANLSAAADKVLRSAIHKLYVALVDAQQ